MTLFTPSSVSLEGKNLWILQSMPVSGAQVLRAKLRMADLLTLPAAVIASVCCVCVTELSRLSCSTASVCALCKRAWSREACARKARLRERGAGRKAELGRDADDARLLGRFARGRRGLADVAGQSLYPRRPLLGFGAVLLFLDTLLLRWLQTAGAERFSRLG